jgi:hypothetical protein
MMDLCYEKTITGYSNEALNMFFEVNDYTKDSNNEWVIEDGWPLTLEDRILFCWSGEDSNGNDIVFYEIEAAANSFAGEWGYTEYSLDIEIEEDFSIDDLISNYHKDRRFFINLEKIFVKFNKMRNEIVHGTLKTEMKDERRIQSSKHSEDIQTNEFSQHLYRSA